MMSVMKFDQSKSMNFVLRCISQHTCIFPTGPKNGHVRACPQYTLCKSFKQEIYLLDFKQCTQCTGKCKSVR